MAANLQICTQNLHIHNKQKQLLELEEMGDYPMSDEKAAEMIEQKKAEIKEIENKLKEKFVFVKYLV